MSSVDNRLVDMKFNYKDFSAGIAASIKSLEDLKKGLKLDGATKGLDGLAGASKRLSLGTISSQLDTISSKFSAMSVVGIAALGTLASKATMVGASMVKSLTIAPVTGGLGEYEKKLSSIQTILSNTQAAGTNLEDVSGALEELNRYSDQTIYNFGEMARNIGTFTAAGVELDTATQAIKGIANVAALSGSTSEQASTAMYQLSQAISEGRVSLESWNSVVTAGMGGTVFQRALTETAVAMGTLSASAVKLDGPMKNVKINGQSFRNAIMTKPGETSWLTSDVLTTALKNFTGDMKEADLTAQGFTKSQAQAIMAQAKLASEAATVVKTGSQLMGTLRESAESGWAQTWELIIGDFEEAKKLWTGVNNVFGGIINSSSDARNNVIKDWKKAGGRLAAIDAIKNIWEAFTRILIAVRQAFREVFPATSGKNLAELTKRFAKFTESLKVGSDNFQRIKSTAEGIFSVFRLVQLVVTSAAKALFNVFGAAQAGSGGVLQITATIGEFVRGLHDLLTQTGALDKFFAIFFSPFKLLQPMLAFLSDIGVAFNSLVTGDISGFKVKMEEAFGTLMSLVSVFGKTITSNIGNFGGIFSIIGDILGGIGGGVGDGVAAVFTKIGDALLRLKDGINVGALFSGLGGGLDATADSASKLSGVTEFLANIWNSFMDALSGVGAAIGPVGGSLNNFFKTLIDKVSEFIQGLDFQEAVALLNAGFFILLYKALKNFMNNINDLVGTLSDAIASITGTFDALTSTLKTMQTNIRANIILKIAIAVGILALAVTQLSKINGDDLKKALAALAGIFVQIGIALALITRYNPASFTSAATGLVLMAFAIKLLAGSIEMLGKMDPAVLIQGGIALGIMMAALSGMLVVMNSMTGIPAAAAGLLILAFALTALSAAVLIYARIDWGTLAKGLAAMALTLVAIGLAMRVMPKGMIGQAAALVILSGALTVFAAVLATLGQLKLSTIVKGLVAMGLALLIVVVAANAMVGALPGAAAMVVMAGALAIMAGVISLLGQMDVSTIIKGLGALLGIFLVIGLASVILGPVIPIIGALALALLAMGKGLFLVGAGMLLFATGLALLAVSGAAGFAVLIVGITSFLNLIPLFVQQLGLGLLAAVVVIREVGPKIVDAIAAIIGRFLEKVVELAPKFGNAIYAMIYEAIKVLVRLVGPFAAAGLKILMKLFQVLGQNIGKIAKVVGDLARKFIGALSSQQPGMIQAGVNFIIKFINGLADAIDKNAERMGRAGGRLGVAIVRGMVKALLGGISEIVGAAKRLASSAFEAAKKKLGINSPSKVFMGVGASVTEGMAKGLNDTTGRVVGATESLGDQAINAMRNSLSNISGLVAENIDATPVIRPVLDLSSVQAGASGMGSMFGTPSVSVDSSYTQAANASAGYESNKEAVNVQNGSDFAEAFSGGMTFNQYNTSPKALTTAEIYRQTRNQLSVAKKGALTVTT